MLKKSLCKKCRLAWFKENSVSGETLKMQKQKFQDDWAENGVECHKEIPPLTTPYEYEEVVIPIDASAPKDCPYALEHVIK